MASPIQPPLKQADLVDLGSSEDPFHDQAHVTSDNATAGTTTFPTPDVGQPPNAGNLVPSTRPSMPEARTMSAVSNVAQGASTPNSDISAPAPVSTPPEAHEDVSADPQVAALQAMFPDMDVSILQTVLEASGGNQDQAIETLLTMNDPDYKPPAHTVQPQANQDDIDEQLARRLYLEDQEAQQAYERRTSTAGRGYQPRQNPPTRQATAPPAITPGEIGAQVKNFFAGAQAKIAGSNFGRGGAGNNPAGSQGGPQPQYQQQFNEVAETGKKYFNTFVSKVKAKIQEYDGAPGTGSQPPNDLQNVGYSSYGQSQATAPQNSYYGNPEPINTNFRPQQGYAPVQSPPTVTGYSVDPPTPVSPPTQTMPTTAPLSATSGLGIAPPLAQRSSFDQGDALPPNFDTSKFGLKPKRPVSLVGTPAANTKGKTKAADDDDIEYVESPFDDR